MTTTMPDPGSATPPVRDTEVREALSTLERLFDRAADHRFDAEYFERLGIELRSLHARLRARHAVGMMGAADDADLLPPELMDEKSRLLAEQHQIIGLLDRMIRGVDSMPDRSLEDLEVFILRGRELIAILRRHEAEEDRLFYLALWRDTGGES